MLPRPLAPALILLLLTATATAAPTLRVDTLELTLPAGRAIDISIENTSAETARELVVRIEMPEGITLAGAGTSSSAWRCDFTARGGSCTVDRFGPGEKVMMTFSNRPTTRDGGHFPVSVTLAARDAGTLGRLDFDLIGTRFLDVTTTSDFGAGSLRAAIEDVNDNPLCGTDVPCLIGFAGPMTIAPATALPPIRKCNVRIEGGDDGEILLRVKPVTLSGENALEGNGLEVRASCATGFVGVVINGLAIHSWPGNGILFATPERHWTDKVEHVVRRSYVGVDATGKLARPNGLRGIATVSPYDVVSISSGLVSANGRSGITLWNGTRVTISTMGIGTGIDFDALGNGASGIASFGVPMVVTESTIVNNAHFGIGLTPGTAEAWINHNNYGGNGGPAIDWGLDGQSPAGEDADSIPNTPVILDAIYDPSRNQSVVRATLRVRRGPWGNVFTIDAYRQNPERPGILSRIEIGETRFVAPEGGEAADISFEVVVPGNHLGRPLALQAHVGEETGKPRASSELSVAMIAR